MSFKWPASPTTSASLTDNLNHVVTYARGHADELLSPLGHSTNNLYNNRLWLVSTTDADGGISSYGHDPHGNVTSLTDSVGNVDSYTFSATNQVLTDANQLGFTRSFVYNLAGDLTQETDKDGRVRQFTLDNLHRETAEK